MSQPQFRPAVRFAAAGKALAISAVLVALPLLAGCATAGGHLPPARTLYIFGDSYSDSGAGYLNTNGQTAVARLAQRLGHRLAIPDTIKDRHDSVNFAVSGAGTGEEDGKRIGPALIGFGMRNQVSLFANQLRKGAIAFDPNTTIFFIAGGLNDRKTPTEQTISNLRAVVQELHALGARRFRLARLPQAIPRFAATARRLNPAYEEFLANLENEFPGSEVMLSKWGKYFDFVMDNSSKFGLIDTKSKCAGRDIFGEDPAICSDPDTHFYYYPDHPSAVVHRIVGDKLYLEFTKQQTPKR